MSFSSPNPWIAFRKPQPSPRLRLFCFPHAGGGASVYRSWQAALPSDIEVCPIQPPGRESRLSEDRFRHMEPLAEALAAALVPLTDLPFAFFGHSLGSIVAFETAHRLGREMGSYPVHLLVSARRAPHLPTHTTPTYDLPSDEFRDRLLDLEGTPTEVLEHPELMELMEPLLRADFELNDTYRPSTSEKLACPVTAYGGVEDSEATRENLEAWKEVSRGPFRMRLFPGGHFYLQQQTAALTAAVAAELVGHRTAVTGTKRGSRV